MTSKKQHQKEQTSSRFESIDRGDNVYVLCDRGIFADICRVMISSGLGLAKCRGYDPFRDKKVYDWYLLFQKGHSESFANEMIRLVKEMELYQQRMEPVLEDATLFLQKIRGLKNTETST